MPTLTCAQCPFAFKDKLCCHQQLVVVRPGTAAICEAMAGGFPPLPHPNCVACFHHDLECLCGLTLKPVPRPKGYPSCAAFRAPV
jgi:hypothetical protein